MNDFWIDANLVLRFLTCEPQDLAERPLRFIQRAERGEITLRITPLVIAEVVWVLGSFCKYPRTQIAETPHRIPGFRWLSCSRATTFFSSVTTHGKCKCRFC